MAEVFNFHRRFGGAVSLEQELTDLTGELPPWARPIWKLVLAWLLPFIRRAKVRRAMRSVDKQAQAIGDEWAARDRQQAVAAAAARAIAQHPDAHVEVLLMPNHPVDAVLIEHPPDPSSKAQMALGFGSIEIREPWIE